MFSAQDSLWMAQALRLAERGLYTTSPNPRVGCMLVREGSVVGEGWHECAGEPHAEVHALQAAGEAAHGATAYVTLEPCSHHGRTPPCADALVQAGVARVVVAVQDPNPQVAGQGIEKLRAAGIEVECGLMEAAARELNIGFFARMTRGMPWVRSKIAMSLDGRTALNNGESKWITGDAARQNVQHWRARAGRGRAGWGGWCTGRAPPVAAPAPSIGCLVRRACRRLATAASRKVTRRKPGTAWSVFSLHRSRARSPYRLPAHPARRRSGAPVFPPPIP